MGPKSTNLNQIQQGDVNLQRVKSIPNGAKKLNHRTLAYGEVTGHHHTIADEDVELYEKDGVLYVSNPMDVDAILTHQTHGDVKIAPGTWRYLPRHEKDHLSEMTRRVID